MLYRGESAAVQLGWHARYGNIFQHAHTDRVLRGRRQPLWWTLRRPARPLTYHAVHRMFERVNEKAGSAATLRPPPRGRDRGRRRVGCAVL
jgi:hypothetical protein